MLLEVLIAASLVAVAMIAVAQLLAVAAQQELAIERRRLGAQEAANSLEQTMALTWEDVTQERLQELKLSEESQQRLPDGRLACELESSADPLPSKRIVADVSWRNRSGDRERVRLTAWRFQSEKKP